MRMLEVYVEWFKGHLNHATWLIIQCHGCRVSLETTSHRGFALRRRRERDRERRVRESSEELRFAALNCRSERS